MEILGQLSPVSFLQDDRIKEILTILDKAMFVGGCVRDSLLGAKECFDIDIATEKTPQEVTEILENSGFKVIPTGIEHGTVTVPVPPFNLEITTLRVDIETDGRHADVEFSANWEEDARRRDFTINALYADINGSVYDFFKGQAFKDLSQRKVKFIGFAEDRIKEDYLRILRYFRFFGGYAKYSNTDATTACRKYAKHISELSVERVVSEFKKILLGKTPETTIKLMDSCEVLEQIIEKPVNVDFLRQVVWLETHGIRFEEVKPNVYRRLIALCDADSNKIKEFIEKLKFSNREKREIKKILEAINTNDYRNCKYTYGQDIALSVILLNWAKFRSQNPSINSATSEKWHQKISNMLLFSVPKLPISGDDFILSGLKQGPIIQEALQIAEELFIQSGYTLSKEDILKKMKL